MDLSPSTPAHTREDPTGACSFESRLSAFHDDELDDAACDAVRQHLAVCEACRAELVEIRELSALAAQIGDEGISAPALRKIHQAVDADAAGYGILRIAGVLTGLAASALIIGSAWLWEMPGTAAPSRKIVIVGPGPDWETICVNLKSDPLPTTPWEVRDQQMLADARLADWMLEGLTGSDR